MIYRMNEKCYGVPLCVLFVFVIRLYLSNVFVSLSMALLIGQWDTYIYMRTAAAILDFVCMCVIFSFNAISHVAVAVDCCGDCFFPVTTRIEYGWGLSQKLRSFWDTRIIVLLSCFPYAIFYFLFIGFGQTPTTIALQRDMSRRFD